LTAISGTGSFRTTITIVAATSGDGDTVAAMFNGIVIPGISNTAAVATNSSGTVTLYWPATAVLEGDQSVLTDAWAMISANTALTSPISATVQRQAVATS
jgi:hypothetical protein